MPTRVDLGRRHAALQTLAHERDVLVHVAREGAQTRDVVLVALDRLEGHRLPDQREPAVEAGVGVDGEVLLAECVRLDALAQLSGEDVVVRLLDEGQGVAVDLRELGAEALSLLRLPRQRLRRQVRQLVVVVVHPDARRQLRRLLQPPRPLAVEELVQPSDGVRRRGRRDCRLSRRRSRGAPDHGDDRESECRRSAHARLLDVGSATRAAPRPARRGCRCACRRRCARRRPARRAKKTAARISDVCRDISIAELDGEQAEQGGELDDRVHRHRRGVLERVADGVADHGGGVQRRALLLEVDLDHLLGVVPGAAGVGHEDRLVEAEERDRDQVADEEERLEAGERQRREEHRQEDVEHALLRVLGADLDHPLASRRPRPSWPSASRRMLLLDELDGAVGAGGDRLGGGAGEPVDDGAAHDQAEQEGRVQERELARCPWSDPSVRIRMSEKISVVAPTTAVPMSTGLAVALKVLPAPSLASRKCLPRSKAGSKPKSLLISSLDAGQRLDGRQLVDRLRVVGDRAVGVDGDGHRAHAQEAERHQAEGEHRRRQHHRAEALQC